MKDEMVFRHQIAQLLAHRCNNCYCFLPGPIGCSVHSPGWHWLTSDVGPLCDSCCAEVLRQWERR